MIWFTFPTFSFVVRWSGLHYRHFDLSWDDLVYIADIFICREMIWFTLPTFSFVVRWSGLHCRHFHLSWDGLVYIADIFFRTVTSNYNINLFLATDLFWYPLKTENQRFSDVFRGYQKRSVAWNGLKAWQTVVSDNFLKSYIYKERCV